MLISMKNSYIVTNTANKIPDLPALIGESPVFRASLAQVSALAVLDRPVLVVGERGTGKELVAARLTYLSTRWDRPFVKLNCAALAESLLDSERFGGNDVQRVDVRLIAASNVDLPSLADEDRFRSDLLDRLAFDVVTIPPLRERAEDISLLAGHFGRGMARELGRDAFPGFTAGALARLAAHGWPGNVRELKNVIERSVHRWPRPDDKVDEIIFDPFASPHRPPVRRPEVASSPAAIVTESAQPGDFRARLRAYEAKLLGEALAASQFNQRRTAQALGLTYHQLRHHLKKHA